MAEFYREFEQVPEETLQWVFREHRRRSQFFPAISEIAGLLCEYHLHQRQAAETAEAARQRTEINQARKEGKLVEFTDIVKRLGEIAQAMPESEATRKLRKAQERPAPHIPTIQLSAEQIAERRKAEQEEITRYKETV